jgi:MoxR-like ATPase
LEGPTLSKTDISITANNLRKRVSRLITKLNHDLLEREETVRLCVLCALACESIFLLGPPGVAKSLIARRVKQMFAGDAKAFDYLMNRFSTPDEIFGPISIKGLKDDRLVRKTDSYLPSAVVVFLDEIWKAGPSIQNALLTAVNERVFRNGGVDQKIPMRLLISASNELPEGKGLEALWDRFLVRLQVDNVIFKQNRHMLIRGSSAMEDLNISQAERFQDSELLSLDQQINLVEIPDKVLAIIDDVIAGIRQVNQDLSQKSKGSPESVTETDEEEVPRIYVSDRRWKKIGRLLRTSAVCNGRTAVDELDCYLITHCIWDHPKHVEPVRRIVLEAIERALGPSARGVATFQQEWKSLKIKANSLPVKLNHKPTPYRDHYKIDLSRHGELLTDDGEVFPEFPKDGYESLSAKFKSIQLAQSRPGKARARVLAKRGSSPVEIILRKDDDLPPLKQFPPTTFKLDHSLSTHAKVIDLTSQPAQQFVAALRTLRARIAEQADDYDEQEGVPDGDFKHLFVQFSPDVGDRLLKYWDDAGKANKGLLKEIDAFMREKGLE